MNTEEKLTRNRIQIQRRNSFFAYLSLYLKFHKVAEDDIRLKNSLGAGVNCNGDFIYKSSFIDKISDDEVQGVIIHEILHLSLLHLLRGKAIIKTKEELERFNVACDIVVNQLIKNNGFKLPKGVLMPNRYNKIKLGNKNCFLEICDTDKKIAEQIYDEIMEFIKKNGLDKGNNQGNKKGNEKDGDGEGGENYIFGDGEGRLDAHIRDTNKEDGNEKDNQKQQAELEKEWIDRTQQALAVSKMKGDTPTGMERFIGKLHESEVGWRTLLLKYVQSYIPRDFNYSYPSKKSISSGVYMPSTTKENVELAVGIDTSGSIGQEELIQFLSEIVGIAKAFRGRIKMHLFTHETEVNDKYVVENGDVKKILELKISGGGGTSHIQPMEYVNKNIKSCKAVIWFTDGYSDLNQIDFTKNKFDSIFVISHNGTDEQLKGKGVRAIKLKND